MSMLRPLVFFSALLFLLPVPVHSAIASDGTPTYVSAATLPPELLPAPPVADSPEWHEELAGILATQQRLRSDAYILVNQPHRAADLHPMARPRPARRPAPSAVLPRG